MEIPKPRPSPKALGSLSLKSRVRRRIIRFLTPPRGLKVTGPGKFFFGFMVVIVALGYVTNNNLLFLIFAAMLSLMIISGILSENSIRKISAGRLFPERIFAGVETIIGYRVKNHSHWWGSFLIGVEDKTAGEEISAPRFIEVPPQQEENSAATVRFPRRGLVLVRPFRLTTTFPFNLFVKTKLVHEDFGPEELVVYPALLDNEVPLRQELAAPGSGSAEISGQGDLVSSLRDYLPGDPLNRIHWKKSAKVGDLLSKVMSAQKESRVLLIFRDDAPQYPEGERAISLAATLARDLYERKLAFAFLAPGLVLEPSAEFGHLERIFTYLALYAPGASLPPEPGGRFLKIIVDSQGKVTIET